MGANRDYIAGLFYTHLCLQFRQPKNSSQKEFSENLAFLSNRHRPIIMLWGVQIVPTFPHALALIFQGTSFPVWIYYRHYLDDSWSFFSKPWCSTASSGVADQADRRGRSSNFLTLPASLCSFGNLAVFSAENSARTTRCYVAVSDGPTISVPKGLQTSYLS